MNHNNQSIEDMIALVSVIGILKQVALNYTKFYYIIY